MENKHRIKWIDISKGIGIISVVMGHSFLVNGSALYLKTIIYGFHMPLFFIVSGYLMREYKDWSILKKRAYSLLIPYVTYSVFIRVFDIVLDYARGTKPNVLQMLLGSVVQIRGTDYAGVAWFLTWMFTAQIIMQCILKISHKEKWRNIICLLCFILGTIFTNILKYKLPWNIDAALVSILFLRIGMIYKRKQDSIASKQRPIYMASMALIYIISLGLNVYVFSGNYIDIYDGRIGNPILYVVAAVAGSSIVICLAIHCAHTVIGRLLALIGQHSLTIYGLHMVINTILCQILKAFGLYNGIGWVEIVRGVICTVICIAIILPIAIMLERKAPVLFGYKRG